MANKVFWTKERILQAYDLHFEHRTIADLAAHLSSEWGVEVTRDAINKIFQVNFKDRDIRKTIGSKLKMREREEIAAYVSHNQNVGSKSADYKRVQYGEYDPEDIKNKHFVPADPKLRGDLILDVPKDRSLVIHVWSDAHVPDHDPAVMEAVLLFAEYMKPDAVVDLGDFLDMGTISSYNKASNNGQSFYDDVEEGRHIKEIESKRLTAAGIHKRFFIMGNHEVRMHKWLIEKAPELYKIVPTIGELLQLKENGWQEISYNGSLRVGHLQITHGRGHSKHVTSKSVESEGSMVYGHTHRVQMTVANTRPGHPEIAMTVGTRGSLIKDYQFHEPNNHVHATGVIVINPDYSINMIPIIIYSGVIKYPLPGGKMLVCDGNTATTSIV